MKSSTVLAPMPRSSGDLLADRRYEIAMSYAEDGDFAAAADIFEQVLERVPTWPVAWNALAQAREAQGDCAAAIGAYMKAAALDEKDVLGAGLHLARLGATTPPDAAPEQYIRSLFDHYAARFDAHLIGQLNYRAPALLTEVVARHVPPRFARVVDLGCGTGLCGAAFREKAETLTGVDLSPQMIAEARRKNIYDALHAENIADFLDASPAASADLLLAADVLVYIGDLDPLFRRTHRTLSANGLFAFTVQTTSSEEPNATGFRIGGDLRYSHEPDYVEAAAQRNGFAVLALERAPTRREAGVDVPGLVVLLQKTESA
ncbi:MAG TPA: methyltransferase domain-containing protein [Methylovirgula sp.]